MYNIAVKKTSAITVNRRAYHDWEILETYETGIALTSPAIKLIRAGQVSLAGSYAKIVDNELLWVGPDLGGQKSRRLLARKTELNRLASLTQKGTALIPLRLYFRRGWAKLELGVARRKKIWDKRTILKKRAAEREARQL